MARKNETNTPAAEAPAVETPVVALLDLTEWCTRQSATDGRVEMLGAFFSIESNAGRKTATAEEFGERYLAFANRPL